MTKQEFIKEARQMLKEVLEITVLNEYTQIYSNDKITICVDSRELTALSPDYKYTWTPEYFTITTI